MENKNIVMLKRHFVSYRNPKQEMYYLNQCRDLADYEVIDVTSRNADSKFKSQISPMFIGPIKTSDGAVCNVFETLWQCSKVYPCHASNGEPTEDYFRWRDSHYAEPRPALNDRKAIKHLRHINEEIGANHSDTLYSLWYNVETMRYEHLSYVQARKKIYFPEYAKLVYETEAFKKLKEKTDAGEKLALLDYDAFNLYEDSVKKKMYLKYTEKCIKNHYVPKRCLGDYMNLKTMKDVVDCPFIPVGHGFALKALLQGDIEVLDGNVVDKSGILGL